MKLKSITIQNFQRHKFLQIDLSELITVIKGSSDRGKTSVIRALNWLIYNKPSGFAFRHNPKLLNKKNKPLKGNEVTFVRFDFTDGSYLERSRDEKSLNQYNLNGKIYSVLRGDVPEDVTKFLGIAPYTIQNQHDGFFLLNDSAGEVAKKLNNLIGLEDIDTITKNINNTVLELKRETERVEKELNENQEEYGKYDFLKSAGALISKIDKLLDEIEETIKNSEEIERLCGIISEGIDEINEIKRWLTVEGSYEEIMIGLKELKETTNNYLNISRIMKSEEEYTKAADALWWIAESEDTVKAITLSLNEIKEAKGKLKTLDELAAKLSINLSSIHKVEYDLIENKETYKDTIGDVCPFCGNPVNPNQLCCMEE